MRGNLDKRNAFKFANVCLSGLTLDCLIVDVDMKEALPNSHILQSVKFFQLDI